MTSPTSHSSSDPNDQPSSPVQASSDFEEVLVSRRDARKVCYLSPSLIPGFPRSLRGAEPEGFGITISVYRGLKEVMEGISLDAAEVADRRETETIYTAWETDHTTMCSVDLNFYYFDDAATEAEAVGMPWVWDYVRGIPLNLDGSALISDTPAT